MLRLIFHYFFSGLLNAKKSSCFALFYRSILRRRPKEKLENAKNIFFKITYYYRFFFGEAVFISILEYLFQKWFFLVYSWVSNPNAFSLKGPLKVYIRHDLRKNIVFSHCFYVPHICLISNVIFTSQGAPKVLLDLNKDNASEKIHIIGGNS